ncbi:ABC transporter ATP-binding protein [Acuticoccus mangrovi]|uniref:ABC transporter ATP-binding protein n=1 Tax=Acuticoccus mangrovi TaxID=2796142 RepID=A0A934IST7_9HYPH|nr:ABC transporter ATP-binding protein [Acuticoccus mangrovi]MBJ3778146.1 ABC transporter ATP-binding protein [Acuticoccus mangrovi]
MAPLLSITDLQVHFRTPRGVSRAVEGVSFDVNAGETLAIVGESGSGKSVTSMAVLRLLPTKTTRVSGSIRFEDRELLDLSEDEMRGIRGNAISMIFQEPMTALNPVLTIGSQIAEALMLHQGLGKRQALARGTEMLDLVGIPAAARRMSDYPHKLSGGMRQRVMIAMALACEPRLLIADEPTTALDVSIQAQILELMRSLKARTGAAVVIVTHDLGVVAEVADRVAVMYAGQKIEEASATQLFARPHHPYTSGLLRAMPRLGTSLHDPDWTLASIPGQVPSPFSRQEGCAFAPRCAKAKDVCRRHRPALRPAEDGHSHACHFPDNATGADHV